MPAAGSFVSQRPHVAIASAATVPLLVLPFLAVRGADNYVWAFLFLVPVVWGACIARRVLDLHPFHFALFALAVILHNLGAFGMYGRTFFGLSFDTYVHFYFALAGGLMLERAFRKRAGLQRVHKWVAVVLCVLGIGALHELIEWGSTLALGTSGMFRNDTDPFDTHKDLLNDLLGCLAALCASNLLARARTQSILARSGGAEQADRGPTSARDGSRSAEANGIPRGAARLAPPCKPSNSFSTSTRRASSPSTPPSFSRASARSTPRSRST